MLEPPFDIVSCSWPRPIEQVDGRWISEPEWDAPLMSIPPQPHWDLLSNELCWTFDWRDQFKQGLKWWNPHMGGEMRGFHIVFRLRINGGGKLVFWDDDSCIIRRNGEIVHHDCSAHRLSCHEIEVSAGDVLEVAQWQLGWDWLWGARLSQPDQHILITPADVLLPYLEHVQQRLTHPDGPPLKIYTDGRTPIRTIAAIYSMILNGYTPSALYLFGEHQWDEQARHLFTTLLPFAQTIMTNQVLARLQSLGGLRLASLAKQYWFVMKAFICLLYPPEEFCQMDDDVFILDRVDDALSAFQHNDLVFAPDQDLGAGFLRTWGERMHPELLHTKRFNAGLYWLRNNCDQRLLVTQALRARPNPSEPFLWEQGYIATLYAHRNTVELPGQRYFFPLFDGLPGGMLGYDYKLNPCGFVSIHFGGLAEKPSNGITLHLVPQILGRYQTAASHNHAVLVQ